MHSRKVALADSAWTAQDRLRSGVNESLHAGDSALRNGFERLTFPLRKRVLWPLEDRAAAAGAPARAVSFAAVILLAAVAGVAGLIWAAPDQPGDNGRTAVEVAAVSGPAATSTAPAKKPPAPTLHGAAPVFKPAPRQETPSEVDPAKAIVSSSPADSTSAANKAADSATAAAAAAARPSAKGAAVDGAPAGPKAVAVAHDFAAAFVVYETGGIDGEVRRAFGASATPELAKALLRRPPRLPANVEVPRAKVVNVVPAPSHAGVYPVSVSLLRVGLTSELRLEMEQLKGEGWRVTNVLG